MAKQIEKIFWHFRAFIYSSSLSLKKITHTNQIRAQKKRDAVRQSPFKRAGVTLRFQRSLLVARTRDANIARFGTTHTHARALEKKRIGNWNGPQPRKDYEFSQREEFYDASFRRRVKGE